MHIHMNTKITIGLSSYLPFMLNLTVPVWVLVLREDLSKELARVKVKGKGEVYR